MSEITLLEFIASQGPAFIMAVIFAWLFFNERKENAALHRELVAVLSAVAGISTPSASIPTVSTLDLPPVDGDTSDHAQKLPF